jgi:hypothetical protein
MAEEDKTNKPDEFLAKALDDAFADARAQAWNAINNYERPARPPGILYHYTTAEAFLAILESKRLRASEGHFSNDDRDLREPVALIRNYLEERGRDSAHPDIILRLALAIERDADRRALGTFVACLSAAADSLSQWRAYADDGRGLALGFDLGEIFRTDEDLAEGTSAPVLRPILYDPERQAELVRNVFGPLVDGLEAALFSFPSNRKECLHHAAFLALSFANLLGIYCKSWPFRHEEEWRIAVMTRTKAFPDIVQFRACRYGIAPFVDLPLGAPFPLREVWIGPRQSRAAERSVGALLQRKELSGVLVHTSTAAYR